MKRKFVKVGRDVYSHSLVVGLIERYHGISQDPKEIMRSLVRGRLDAARDFGWGGPPFDPRVLASTMGIHAEGSRKLTLSDDAELHPTSNGKLVIRYNPDRPKARQNFSIAHEISHTFFPNYQDQINARYRFETYDPHNELELLCDVGASEIILPSPEFDSDVSQKGISLSSLKSLSTRYEASPEATAIRMIGTSICPCALLVLDFEHKPVELSQIEAAKYQLSLFDEGPPRTPSTKLRVQYCVSSKRFSTFIPKHKSIDESCALYDVSVNTEEYRGNVRFPLEYQELEFYAEAMAIPSRFDSDLGSRVLAILLLQ